MTKDKDSIRISQSRNGHISIDQSLPQPEHGHGMKKKYGKSCFEAHTSESIGN